MQPLVVRSYDPVFRHAFYSINKSWLEEYFSVTKEDEAILLQPELIREAGGEIFFVVDGDKPVGTCAMIREHDGIFELAKMGVLAEARGHGAGALLLQACIDFAQSRNARCITLETSRKLPHALALYERFGFVRDGEEYVHPRFGRTVFRMIKKI